MSRRRASTRPAASLSSALSNRAFGPTNEDILWEIQCRVISELAEKGPCVIVGRCADYILQDKAKCLKVFIHADMAFRAKRIVEVYGEREQSPGSACATRTSAARPITASTRT